MLHMLPARDCSTYRFCQSLKRLAPTCKKAGVANTRNKLAIDLATGLQPVSEGTMQVHLVLLFSDAEWCDAGGHVGGQHIAWDGMWCRTGC